MKWCVRFWVVLGLVSLLVCACTSPSVHDTPMKSPLRAERTAAEKPALRSLQLVIPQYTTVWVNGIHVDRKKQLDLTLKTGDHLLLNQSYWIVKKEDRFLHFRYGKATYGTDCFLDTGYGERLVGIIFHQKVTQNQFDQTVLSNLDLFFITLFHCKQVTSLAMLPELRNLEALNVWGLPLTDVGILEGVPSLKCLDLTGTEVTDDRMLAKITSLECLKWHVDRDIKRAGALGKLTHLRMLALNETGITDFGFLTKLKRLTCLKLGYSDFADTSLLAGLRQLRHLGLARTKVRDIEPLSKLTKLKYLNAGYTRFADVSALHNLTGLRTIILTNSRVSDEAISALQKQLPACKIYY